MKENFEWSRLEGINEKTMEEIEDRIKCYALRRPEDIENRLAELDHEWNIERFLDLKIFSVALIGTILGITKTKKWLLLSGVALPFLLLNSTSSRNPLHSIFSEFGFRNKKEIELERYALKALRGDFKGLDDKSEESDQLDLAMKVIDSIKK